MSSTKRSLTRTPGRGNSNKKRKNSNAGSDDQTEEVEIPRRQTRGKKIDVISMLGSLDNEANDIEDSDEDPVWKPEEAPPTRLSSHTKRKNAKPKPHETRKIYITIPPWASRKNNRSTTQVGYSGSCAIDKEYFKVGSFLILRSDFRANIEPLLWQIDGKTLLLRYDVKNDNGTVTYFPTNVYASCLNPKEFLLYLPVSVGRSCTSGHVTFTQKNVKLTNCPEVRMLMDQTLPLWSNFVIFLQIWTSQALDSNFLTEIRQENDEFFLAAIRTIYDQETVYRLNSVMALLNLKQDLAEVMCYPVLKLQNLIAAYPKPVCSACNTPHSARSVLVGGNLYCPEAKDLPDEDVNAHLRETDLKLCCVCADIVVALHTLKHIKYFMYQQCVQKVKTVTPKADRQTLQDILLDDDWMNEIFYFLRLLWAECDFSCESRSADNN